MKLDKYVEDKQSLARVSTQGRVDIRHLAALSVYFADSGARPKSRSHLMYMIVGVLHDVLVENEIIPPVSTISDAYNILTAYGISWPEGGEGHRAIVRELENEDRLAESLRTIKASPAAASELAAELERMLERGEFPRSND